jgi:hypothetical protein
VAPADVVRLTVRAAREVEHLDDRIQTLVDTGPDGGVEVTPGAGDLLPEVYDALIGTPVGSTVVVEVDARSHGLQDAVGAAAYFLELTITDVRERAPEAVHVLAERRIPEPPEVALRRRLTEALQQARRQPQGRVVQVDDDLRGRADELARALAAQRRLAPPQPLGRSGDGEALLLEPALWQAMLDAMTGPA